jgi:hypothetical protein
VISIPSVNATAASSPCSRIRKRSAIWRYI